MKIVYIDPLLKDYQKYLLTQDIKDLKLDLENQPVSNFELIPISTFNPKEKFRVNKKSYRLQKNINKLPYGRFLIYQTILKTLSDNPDSQVHQAHNILAPFIYKNSLLRKFKKIPHSREVREISNEILEWPVSRVFSCLSFFLKKLMSSSSNIQGHCLRKKQMTTQIQETQELLGTQTHII